MAYIEIYDNNFCLLLSLYEYIQDEQEEKCFFLFALFGRTFCAVLITRSSLMSPKWNTSLAYSRFSKLCSSPTSLFISTGNFVGVAKLIEQNFICHKNENKTNSSMTGIEWNNIMLIGISKKINEERRGEGGEEER